MLALILRVLLCLGVVFGGTNSAVAAVQAHLTHAQAEQPERSAAADAAGAGAPCHGQPSPADESVASHAGHPDPRGTDCCQSMKCDGTCAHPAQEAFAGQRFDGGPVPGESRTIEPEPERAAPAPQRPIRPPIG
jgi:hypothetical protein